MAQSGHSPFRRHFSELDLSARMHTEPLRRTAWLIAIGTLVSACFASEVFYSWAFNLPLWTGPVRDTILPVAEGWHDAMTTLGLTEVQAALRDLLQAFRDW
ncbi:MAG: hypothetical protein GVY13_16715 [Alphaproteobacteria bacterium]|jgi:hypothetical protein|nr:hypothetical protein [Alphaproteobacteria bacterium]